MAKNSDSKVEWYYDVVGNLVKEHIQDNQTGKTAVWKHGYDELDNRNKTIRPDGQKIEWLTYGTGHVYGLALNGEDLVSFERDDLHRETARHYANGLSQFEDYDESGSLSQQTIVNGHENGYSNAIAQERNALKETQQLLARVYQYDKAGQLAHIQDSRRGDILYKYDPLGRLLEAKTKLGKETFSFDPASNLLDPYLSTEKKVNPSQKAETKGYGYNRLVTNVVKEYLDQQFQYDAYGQLVRQKTCKGDLNLEWDVLGRLIKSRNKEYIAEYRYDAMGRRLTKRSKHQHTGQAQENIYGWDGDTLAYESNTSFTKHYIYEKDNFIPLIQAIYTEQIKLHSTPEWNDKYSFNKDPLWKMNHTAQAFNELCYYHCDHLGTPQELSNAVGEMVWKADYKAWGELVSAKQRFEPENYISQQDTSYARSDNADKTKSNLFENSEIITNNIRFQGS